MTELYVLLLLMIAGALAAIGVRNLLSSVVAVGVVGLALSLAFLLMKAPDIALTQLVVEIMAVIILIRATLSARLPDERERTRPVGILLGAAFAAVAVLASVAVFRDLPAFGSPLMTVSGHYTGNAVSDTGSVNVVTAIILDYRAYDTLGEATVLFTSVVGVLTVLRPEGRRHRREENQ